MNRRDPILSLWLERIARMGTADFGSAAKDYLFSVRT